MSRIKLRNLLNLTEQAPQAPVPQNMPPSGPPMGNPAMGQQPEMPAQPPEAPEPTEPEDDAAPAPEDPSEYDFTKDFRAFEDKKTKAENSAKKEFLGKINKMIVGKKITANASRGYGQPKTDHTIDSVKSVSVEFWYKDYVVIVKDQNDKQYFLTPGINIKIEGGAPGTEEPAQDEAPQPEASPAQGEVPPPQEPQAPEIPKAGTPPPAEPAAGQAPQAPQAPAPNPAQQPVQTQPQTPAEEDPRIKKKPVTEGSKYHLAWVQDDVGKILAECVVKSAKDRFGKFDVKKYVIGKPILESIDEETSKATYTLELPVTIFERNFDMQDLKLTIYEGFRSYNGSGQQFTRGSVDIQRIGRFYRLRFEKQLGWDI